MKLTIAILIGKLITLIGKPLHKSSNFPGIVALKICPSLMKDIKIKGTVIAVTGSNGKTSSANLISHILTSLNYKVVNNAKGSNLTGGIATSLLNASNLRGEIDSDYVVFEVDERFSRLIFKDIKVDYLLVTNLFRDQLTRNGNIDVIKDILNNSIPKNTTLILNGNDPISSLLALDNKRIYYALDKTAKSNEFSLNITHDAKVCPKCYHKLSYEYYHYNHIGKFKCLNCNYEIKDIAYLGKNVDYEKGSLNINGINVSIALKTPFNYLNTIGSIALCSQLNINFEDICKAASSFKPLKERFEEFKINGRKATMILSKNQNPVSYDQSIDYYLSNEKGTVVVYINNINHTNNKDTTWLYDIAFERLIGHIDNIICAGPRALDLAARLKLAGIDEDKTIICDNLKDIKEAVHNTNGHIYFLTELYDAKTIVKAAGK